MVPTAASVSLSGASAGGPAAGAPNGTISLWHQFPARASKAVPLDTASYRVSIPPPIRSPLRAPVSPPQAEELKLTLPRAVADRLEQLERRLEKLERQQQAHLVPGRPARYEHREDVLSDSIRIITGCTWRHDQADRTSASASEGRALGTMTPRRGLFRMPVLSVMIDVPAALK